MTADAYALSEPDITDVEHYAKTPLASTRSPTTRVRPLHLPLATMRPSTMTPIPFIGSHAHSWRCSSMLRRRSHDCWNPTDRAHVAIPGIQPPSRLLSSSIIDSPPMVTLLGSRNRSLL